MYSCRQITQLVSDGMDRKLSLSERLQIRVHFLVCGACVNFEKQVQAIRGFSRAMLQHLPERKDD